MLHFATDYPQNNTDLHGRNLKINFKSFINTNSKKKKKKKQPAFPAQQWCNFSATENYSRGLEILSPITHRVNYTGKYCNGLSPVTQLTYTTSFSITNLSALPSVKTNVYLVLPVSALALPLVELAAAAPEESPDCLCFPLCSTIFLPLSCTLTQGNALSLLRCAREYVNYSLTKFMSCFLFTVYHITQ